MPDLLVVHVSIGDADVRTFLHVVVDAVQGQVGASSDLAQGKTRV